MLSRNVCRGGWAAALTLALVVAPAGAGQKKNAKEQQKLDKELQQHTETAVKLVDAVMTGQATADAPAFTIGWKNDFLKAEEGFIYVPFTISIDAEALTTPAVTFFIRAVSRSAAAGGEGGEKEPAPYPFEGVWFPELKSPAPGQPYQISRAFAVPAGEYDVYVAVRERPDSKNKKATPKGSVLKQPMTVPDFWNGELTTSSVIVADGVQQLATPLAPGEQVEHPYTIGLIQIMPAADSTYATNEELSVVFLIYNPALTDKKPDVQVEYKFHQITADGEKYFNRTPPNVMNADTLGAGFDLEAGHQLVAGQSVPLASFPPGDYRLEIEVVDKLADRTLTRDVLFTVAGS